MPLGRSYTLKTADKKATMRCKFTPHFLPIIFKNGRKAQAFSNKISNKIRQENDFRIQQKHLKNRYHSCRNIKQKTPAKIK